jgi:hypothetical protein
MKQLLKNNLISFTIVFVAVMGLGMLNFSVAQAGVCTDIIFTKDGKTVTQSGSVTVPAKDAAKYQIKAVVKAKSKTTCKDTYVRIGVIYIDQLNKAKPVSYVLPATKIPDAGLTKTFNFATTDPNGIYNYSVETYNIKGTDIQTPDGSVNMEGLRITLGQAGQADTGDKNIDYKSPEAKEYAGKNWDGELSILNPISNNGSEVKDISQLANKIINWLLLILGVIATLMIIYAGVLLVFNGGNESQVKKAKTTLTWAIIGLVVSLCAFAIVTMVQALLG